jgi:hypothetical protein
MVVSGQAPKLYMKNCKINLGGFFLANVLAEYGTGYTMDFSQWAHDFFCETDKILQRREKIVLVSQMGKNV